MKRNRFQIISAILFAFFFSTTAGFAAQNTNFKVFNAINYVNTPNLRPQGFHDIKIIYEASLTLPPATASKERGFSSSMLTAAASPLANNQSVVSLDIESWNTNADALKKYKDALKIFKQKSPGSVVGLYGFFPFANALLYKSIENNNPLLRARWEAKQKAASKIAESADVYMPSLYTWGPDFDAWKKTTELTIQKAREANPNKPIYAFIWPQYYDSYKPHAREFINASTWRKELETLYPIVDGVIIWSSSKDAHKRPIRFSTSMPWYKETLSFMADHNIH